MLEELIVTPGAPQNNSWALKGCRPVRAPALWAKTKLLPCVLHGKVVVSQE
jgi:hypothetical protein